MNKKNTHFHYPKQTFMFFEQSNQRARFICTCLFFLAFLAVGLHAYKDYGVSWDEPRSRMNGMISLDYLGEIFDIEYIQQNSRVAGSKTPLAEYTDRDYGVAFELPAGILETLLGINNPHDVYLFRHLLTFLVCFAGIFAVFRLSERRFSDWRLGLLGALFVILTPRLYAESFYNDKDAVFMALFAIALNTSVKFVKYPAYRNAVWNSLAAAVLVDVRVAGIILPVATLVMIILRLFRKELALRETLPPVCVFMLLSMLFVVAMWPYLWVDPWSNFWQAFQNMSRFRWEDSVLYMAETIPASQLPWHYIPVWICITTPLFYIFLFMAGAIDILRVLVSRGWSLWHGDDEWQDLLFLGLFIAPVLAVIAMNSVLYDGWRQLYFIYPVFVLVALRGWIRILGWRTTRYPVIWPGIFGIATFASFLYTGAWMIRSHPFQNVYFNVLAGKNVRTKFDVDYWAVSSRYALQYIALKDKGSRIHVWAGSRMPLRNGLLLLEFEDRKRFRVVKKESIADYIITQYRGNLIDYGAPPRGYKRFYEISVGGEPIIAVYKTGNGKGNP